ncbi:MAG: exonuclease SbcCD subunit D C-terminal domain-containing protein [Tannerellaceae bacterium]|jgi:exonuclease SbcD|nr:exonuclease SbcCD subunit D C-terminal domain-containing protein [Tannerellaceae bacterium]
MRLIHTADWHIGQSFFEYDRQSEHLCFLQWLRAKVKETGVDALLLAGDVFDGPNPSAVSQRMFYGFLREVTTENPRLQIVIIAGNHDSGARLEAPDPLLKEMNITVRGALNHTLEGEIDYNRLIVPLHDATGNIAAWCLAVPYLRQTTTTAGRFIDCDGDLGGDDADGVSDGVSGYAVGVGLIYRRLYDMVADKSKPIIAMGHLQATGAEISGDDRSERTIIGGLECVPPESFTGGITYTALGHLHRAQQVSGRSNVRYSGSPLPMSFAEKNNRQGVTLVEITTSGAHHKADIERIPFTPPVRLLSIPKEPKPPADILDEIALLPDGDPTALSPYVEIKALITEPEPSLRYRIEEALSHKQARLTRIVSFTPQGEGEAPVAGDSHLQSVNPMDMAAGIFRKRYGGKEMPEAMRSQLEEVIKEAEQ